MKIHLRLLMVAFAISISGCLSTNSSQQEEPVITHFNGAYQFDDGTLVTIGASNAERVRMLRYSDGQPLSIYVDDENRFKASKGFNSQTFSATGQFNFDDSGNVTGADWQEPSVSRTLTRLPVKMKTIHFQSGDLALKGELTIPEGEGKFPLVITVHGSEDSSAVDYYQWPYILAAHGIAGFKFDKRGTGGSEGEYTQNFSVLANDVIAAVEHLSQESFLDMDRVNLIGFSQGGWIAPLVAKRVDIQSYIVAFGTSVPVSREDRWGYVKRLLDSGYGETEIAYADEINEQVTKVIIEHDENAWESLFELTERYENTEWFKTIAGSDSLLGMVAETLEKPWAKLMPNFGWKLYTKWKKGGAGNGPGVNRTYDPMATLKSINTPSLWLLSGEDTSLPTPETVNGLKGLTDDGLPIQYRVYLGAEHGHLLYTTDADGERTYTGYVPHYFSDVVEYFKSQNDS